MTPDVDTVNKLYLELSQFATATTKREMLMAEFVEAARHVVAQMPGGGYRIIVEDWNLRRLEELDAALKRHDEAAK